MALAQPQSRQSIIKKLFQPGEGQSPLLSCIQIITPSYLLKVDIPPVNIRVHKFYPKSVTHFHTFKSIDEPSFHRGMHKANPRPLDRSAGDDSIELLSNP